MTFPPSARNYLLKALGGMPDVLEYMVRDLGSSDPRWDHCPDPVRFSLREVVAHLADWEPIWLERFARTRDESRPFLPSVDEGQLAVTNDYKHADPLTSLSRFRTGRAELVELLDQMTDADWSKLCEREFVGPLSMSMMGGCVLSHDGYHIHQVVEWLAKA